MTMMKTFSVMRGRKKWVPILMVGVGCALLAVVASADMMSTICRNEVVSVGDRKGEVLKKCGPPLSRSQDAVSSRAAQAAHKKKTDKKRTADEKDVAVRRKTTKERADTWTYIIDGSYRFFIFKDGRLATIEAGGLAN
jgi:hypothetical protein